MLNLVQRGDHITVAAAPAALDSGEAILIGDSLFGVATGPAGSGAEVVLALRGVFRLPKATGAPLVLGAAARWDATPGNLVATAGDAIVGAVVEAAGSDATTCLVRLSGAPIPVAAFDYEAG